MAAILCLMQYLEAVIRYIAIDLKSLCTIKNFTQCANMLLRQIFDKIIQKTDKNKTY